jgi:2-keto-3-deoxy-L-rhamnonate aldolase RhmA
MRSEITGFGEPAFSIAAEAARRANDAVILGVLIETVEGVDNIDSILEVDGIDLVWLGSGDLATELAGLGMADQLGRRLRRVQQAVRSAGLPTIAACLPKDVSKAAARGARLIANVDFHLINQALENALKESRDRLTASGGARVQPSNS